MSKFRVGQMVRIRYSKHRPDYIGMETTITGAPEHCARYDGDFWIGYPVAIDPNFFPRELYLEPATDSYDVVSWDACVWKPEHLRVGA